MIRSLCCPIPMKGLEANCCGNGISSRLRSIGCASVDRVINDLVSELAFLVTSSPASSRICQ
jgi:hypothetical protein